jgi:CTP synthase
MVSKLHIWTGSPKLGRWERVARTAENPKERVRIAMVGKYVDLVDSYKSLNEALDHGGIANECAVDIVHVDSELIEKGGVPAEVKTADGILVPMGFGPRGTEGKIAAVRFARESNVPFLGICFGMQMAVIEFARNVCGLEHANSTEVDPQTPHPVIDLMLEQRNLSDLGGTMRLGAYPCVIKEGSLAQRVYGRRNISERHRHRYEFNTKYRERIEEAGMVLSGTSPDGTLVEMIEIPGHPWFLASQFHPEFKSKPLDCHPMFKGFVRAALAYRRTRAETPPLKGLRVVASSERST